MATDYKAEATVTNGVLRWCSNGRVPPAENCTEALFAGLDVDLELCALTREEETREFLRAYRANPPQPTAEDFAEMRSAFGAGTVVANAVTGQRWQL